MADALQGKLMKSSVEEHLPRRHLNSMMTTRVKGLRVVSNLIIQLICPRSDDLDALVQPAE